MPTTFTTCDQSVHDQVASLVRRCHGELKEAEVTFNLLFAAGEDGEPALKAPGGWPAAAKVKINNLRDRVAGLMDVTILLDGDTWEKRTEAEQRAILDHELQHLEVCRNDKGMVKRDDAGRPKLRMRMHDWELAGFDAVLDRHKASAVEFQAAKQLTERESVQRVFSFMLEAAGK